MHPRRLVGGVTLIGLSLILVACSGGGGSTAQPGGGTSTGAAGTTEPTAAGGASAAAGSAGAAAGGANGFEGSIASSGLYSAAWTVAPGVPADPLNSVTNATLASDTGAFGNLRVLPDGSVAFGSAASELNANSSYDGTGAKITLDSSGAYVCAFTIDSDLKGNHDGAVLHMTGGLTVHWHPEGLGGVNCP